MQMLLSPTQTEASMHQYPETEVLTDCIRVSLGQGQESRLRCLVETGLDWELLFRLAARHGLLPLLYWNLSHTCAAVVPTDRLDRLKFIFHSNVQRNLKQSNELVQVLAILEQAQIPAMPFKGLVLAIEVYQNLGLRSFGDLDLLIQPQHLERATQLLLDAGYELDINLGWESHLHHPQKQISIDLHQALTPDFFSFQLPFEGLRSRQQSLSFGGKSIPHFSPEDTLLVLCTQIAKDCCHWRLRLMQLSDLAHLMQTHPHLNWKWLMEQANHLGIRRIVLFSLSLVQNLFAISLPDSISDALQADPIIPDLYAQVVSKLWTLAEENKNSIQEPTFWSFLQSYHHQFYLRLRERPIDRAFYLFRWLSNLLEATFTPNERDRDLLPLPNYLGFLHYPFHVVRLIKERGLGFRQ